MVRLQTIAIITAILFFIWLTPLLIKVWFWLLLLMFHNPLYAIAIGTAILIYSWPSKSKS